MSTPQTRSARASIEVLAVLFVLCLAGCATSGSNHSDTEREARRAFDNGRLHEARAYAEMAMEEHPGDRDLPQLLAAIDRAEARKAREAGRLEEAYHLFRRAAQRESLPRPRGDDLMAAVEIGQKLGKPPGRLAVIAQKAVQDRPESMEAREAAATLWDNAGQAERALPHYRWIWKRQKSDPGLGLRLAALLNSVDRTGESIEVYRQVLLQQPDNVQANINLAGILAQTGRERDARQIYEELLETYPENAALLMRYAGFLERNGQPERADALREQARELMPGVQRREMRDLQ
jgi:tetratricopeptide (TPR) repeat protein